jgi:hypothetical protein
MKSIYTNESTPEIPRLALRPREAAIALGMSEKTLFSRKFPRGDIPAVKVGSRVAYFPHQIREWADREFARQQADGGEK